MSTPASPESPKPPHTEADALEIKRVNKLLTPTSAASFDDTVHYNNGYNMWAIHQYDLAADVVINEFLFQKEVAAKEVAAHIAELHNQIRAVNE